MSRYLVFLALLGHVFADFKLLVLHVNDMHSRFQPTDKFLGICEDTNPANCYGGMARVKSVAEMKKKEAAGKGRETVFLNAGDNFQGTPFYTMFKSKVFSEVIDKIGFDAMSFGNHEFDDGVSGVAPFVERLNTPLVCANIDISKEPSLNSPKLTKSIVLERKGVKIGIIGYLTPNTKILSKTGNLVFIDEIPAIRSECKRLKEQGVNILIALGHSGYLHEIEMAKEIEEIDVIVGGHSHTFLYSGDSFPDKELPKGDYPTVVTQKSGKEVPVVQAYFATKYLGHLELDFDDQGNLISYGGAPILLSGDLPEDREIVDIVSQYASKIKTETTKVVGYTKSALLDNNDMRCKLGECNVGNFLTDAFVDYAKRTQDSVKGYDPNTASISIMQAGFIRASIDGRNNEGAVTLGDVMTVIPWGVKVVIHTIPGQSLLAALEHSVARYEDVVVGHVSVFLQVSGLHVVYDLTKPAGNRVVSVKAVCSECLVPTYYPLDPKMNYKVVMSEYIAGGGDGFSMLKSLTDPIVLPEVDYEVVKNYFGIHTPVYPTVEDRSVLIGADKALAKGKAALEESTHADKGKMTRILTYGALGTALTMGVGIVANIARTKLLN